MTATNSSVTGFISDHSSPSGSPVTEVAGDPVMIRMSEVAKSYDGGRSYSVEGLNLKVHRGELVVLLGESGCGKTTTLKMINRLIERTSGSIHVDGREVGQVDPVQLRRSIGYVLQGVGLFPHMSVAENIAIVPRLLGWTQLQIRERTDELLELVKLDPVIYRDRLPKHLSGGQQQRIGVARALAARSQTMLMDEPFGALDPITRDELQDEYRRIHEALGLTTVMVTHDMAEALMMADRIAAMVDGRIIRIGTPHDLLSDPGDPYVAQLLQMPRKQARRIDAMLARDPEPLGIQPDPDQSSPQTPPSPSVSRDPSR